MYLISFPHDRMLKTAMIQLLTLNLVNKRLCYTFILCSKGDEKFKCELHPMKYQIVGFKVYVSKDSFDHSYRRNKMYHIHSWAISSNASKSLLRSELCLGYPKLNERKIQVTPVFDMDIVWLEASNNITFTIMENTELIFNLPYLLLIMINNHQFIWNT